jgi:hypothetical protein
MQRRQWIALTVALAGAGSAFAQAYPNKPVKLCRCLLHPAAPPTSSPG